VQGQPKTNAEYIQATSRVGRDPARPGLVVTLLNLHKPRDRSHYERFRHYHETFYRGVEAASLTPFAARALDRGFAGAVVAFARHALPELTPPRGVERLVALRATLEARLLEVFLERLRSQPFASEAEREERMRSVQNRIAELLDAWVQVLAGDRDAGGSRQYQRWEEANVPPLLQDLLATDFAPSELRRFRVGRSLREVEPAVNLFLARLDGSQEVR
jgi:hypothetical protein